MRCLNLMKQKEAAAGGWLATMRGEGRAQLSHVMEKAHQPQKPQKRIPRLASNFI